tara:strand:- start:377 stop:631 length:255 start_codon:yes stop_codon:yes gene_type:complete
MTTLVLTELEQITLEQIVDNTDISEGSIFSNVDLKSLSEWTSIETKKLRGVISSLIKKGLVYLDDVDGDGTELVYLEDEFFYLK